MPDTPTLFGAFGEADVLFVLDEEADLR